MTDQILRENSFDIMSGVPVDMDFIEETVFNPVVPMISQDKTNEVIDEFNTGKKKTMQIDETQIHESFVVDEYCVNISIDNVSSVEQK